MFFWNSLAFSKTKDKDKIFKSAREKQQITHKGTTVRLSAGFQQKLKGKLKGNNMIYLKR